MARMTERRVPGLTHYCSAKAGGGHSSGRLCFSLAQPASAATRGCPVRRTHCSWNRSWPEGLPAPTLSPGRCSTGSVRLGDIADAIVFLTYEQAAGSADSHSVWMEGSVCVSPPSSPVTDPPDF